MISLHGHNPRAEKTFDPEHMYYYGDLLAKKGYVVFEVNIDHSDIEHEFQLEAKVFLPQDVPFPFMGQRTWMVVRAIDFVTAQPGVDPEKIAVVGLSNGSLTTMFVAAVDERVKLAVASGSLITHARMWRRELVHCRCQYLNRLEGQLDYSDVFALVAPRALVIQSGERDRGFPVGSAQKAFVDLKEAYETAGAPAMVYHDVHDRAHEFRSEVPLEWFEKVMPLPSAKN